ncbi:expressed unknown protein [Seminavis robusta]|uniref:CRAL-TRIO domain-containing protein n=1 Tax=Seminavis robusta TaxID=568900 RepID=A0A9N8EL57_9STRA|nr:expressed unknown protein [Seminavis robusta]|eukprot:Sro1294_g260190.1 n/a (329) ;mRNA; r:14651-15637
MDQLHEPQAAGDAQNNNNSNNNGGQVLAAEGVEAMEARAPVPTIHHRPQEPYEGFRMRLRGEERQWARAIKAAIEAEPDLQSLPSDFDYAQLACVDLDDVEEAVARTRRMQYFQQELEIEDSLESGLRFIREAVRLFPGFFLGMSFTYARGGGHYTMAVNTNALNNGRLSNADGAARKTLMTALYHCLHALNPDFESTVQGIVILVECDHFDWNQHGNLAALRHIQSEVGVAVIKHYPTEWHQVRLFNTGMVFNMIMSLMRPFLPLALRGRVRLGCSSALGNLENIFVHPNLEASNERFLMFFEDCLHRRYSKVASFSLDYVPPDEVF